MTTVCYYITGHGLGHAIRSSQVIRAFSDDVHVIVRSTAPENVLRSEIERPFEYVRAEFDCGCVQQDSLHIRRRETLDRYAAIASANVLRLGDEAAFLRANGVTAVLSDIVPFAFEAAASAGVPSYAVTNFTWHDVYTEYIDTGADRALVEDIARQYRLATDALITPLGTPTVAGVFDRSRPIPLISRRGRLIGDELRMFARTDRNLAGLYFGIWGLDLDWSVLAELSSWTFLTWDCPDGAPTNVVSLAGSPFAHRDVAASVDVLVGKTGYGTCSECIVNDVPMVFIPRFDFIEHEAIVAGMEAWGGAVPISLKDFQRGRWADALSQALTASRNREAYPSDGAEAVVQAVEDSAIRA